jgi:voltage-gated potassium channel
MLKSIRTRTHALLDPKAKTNFSDAFVNDFIIGLIILNAVAVILESVDSIYAQYKNLFHYFDLFSIAIFTIEYILRVWTCTLQPQYKHPFWGRLKYMVSLGAIIDLVAFLPFYIPYFINVDLRTLRILRLLRFLRVFKMGRYTKASKIIFTVLHSKREALLVSFLITIFLMISASTIMFFVEHEAQPEAFSNIPAAMWWSVTTLTTVGYGDVIPITNWGKFISGVISLLGFGLFALPAGILASGFSNEFSKTEKKHFCPNCGHNLN